MSVIKGNTVSLNCTVPRNASVRWFHNDTALQVSTQQLVLRNINVIDGGMYKCCAIDCDPDNMAVASVTVACKY